MNVEREERPRFHWNNFANYSTLGSLAYETVQLTLFAFQTLTPSTKSGAASSSSSSAIAVSNLLYGNANTLVFSETVSLLAGNETAPTVAAAAESNFLSEASSALYISLQMFIKVRLISFLLLLLLTELD